MAGGSTALDFGRARVNMTSLLAPDLAGGLDAKPQLRALLFLGEVVAVVGAGEAALRADAEVLERHELRSLLDAPFQDVLGLELGKLGGNQAEHHLLALRDVAQGLEAARALVVVLEEKTIYREGRKGGLCDVVVAPAREPGALEVAAAGVHRD